MRAVVTGPRALEDSGPRPTNARLGRYVLRYEIASGGMATVYLAQMGGAQGFGKWVAIKWVHPHLARDPRFVRMLIDEARTTSRIDHPAVCQVLDFVEEDGRAYIVMEYLHGESLVSVMRRAKERGGLPVPHAVRIAVQVARGLHAAHEARGPDGAPLGIVHRDVSPHNVHVLYSGGAKVLDFGIALARDRIAEATATDELKGKPAYMAPEQILGGEHDRRADIWSLGVVLWELLTEQRLFRSGNDAQTLLRVLHDAVPPPSTHRAEVSPELDDVLARALDRDVSRRFATAADLADALEAAMLGRKEVSTESHVAAWMEHCHVEGRALRESLLHARFPQDAGILAIDLHQGRVSPVSAGSTKVTVTAHPPRARRARSRKVLVALASIAVAISGLSTLAIAMQREPAAAAPPNLSVSVAPSPAPLPASPVASPVVVLPPPARIEIASVPTPSPVIAEVRRAEQAEPPAAPGRLNVLAVPAGEVFFHGERLGDTPLVGQTLPAGRQRVEVRWADARRVVSVRIRSDELTTLTVRAEDP